MIVNFNCAKCAVKLAFESVPQCAAAEATVALILKFENFKIIHKECGKAVSTFCFDPFEDYWIQRS